MAYVHAPLNYIYNIYDKARDLAVQLQQSMTKRFKQNEMYVLNAYINNTYVPKPHVNIVRNIYL